MIRKFISKIYNIKFYFFFKKNYQKKFKSENKKIILLEYFKYKPSIIPFYYFSHALQEINKSSIFFY